MTAETEAVFLEENEGIVIPELGVELVPVNVRPLYEVQQVAKTGRWQVVRIGPKGGKKLVNSYEGTEMGRTAALTMSNHLTLWAGNE